MLKEKISLPRMRGDRPEMALSEVVNSEFTPHARGSTPRRPRRTSKICVYPACAGIDHPSRCIVYDKGSLPRMRGDRPLLTRRSYHVIMFTPHARGSTLSLLCRMR